MKKRKRKPSVAFGTLGRSTLAGKRGKYVGFGFGPHPIKPGWSIQIMVFHSAPNNFYIGLADVAGPGDWAAAMVQLGSEIDMGEVAPWIQRGIDGDFISLPLVKDLFRDKLESGYRFAWVAESEL